MWGNPTLFHWTKSIEKLLSLPLPPPLSYFKKN